MVSVVRAVAYARRPSPRGATADTLRWWLGAGPSELQLRDLAARVRDGSPIALVGGQWDDIDTWAHRIDPYRAIVDLRPPRHGWRHPPSASHLRLALARDVAPFILAARADHVAESLGEIAAPYYLVATPLAARRRDAVLPLMRDVVGETTGERLDAIGVRAVAQLGAYRWRGLGELRKVATVIATLLDAGNVTAAAARLNVSRQAVAKLLLRRADIPFRLGSNDSIPGPRRG